MIATRPAIADDRDFIVSGWSSSYRASRNETRPMALYADQMHEEVEFYLARCDTLVAHGATGLLFGFISFDPSEYIVARDKRVDLGAGRIRHVREEVSFSGYLLYIYVAAPFRRRPERVARALFAAAGIDPSSRFGYLYQTRSSWELRSKIPLAEHQPYRARYEETGHGRRTEAAASRATEERPDPGREDLAP